MCLPLQEAHFPLYIFLCPAWGVIAKMATQTTLPLVQQAQKMQLIKGERHLFSSSDDNVVMKQILATHSPDGRDIDVRPILNVIEDILKRASPTTVVVSFTPLLKFKF